MNNLKKIIKLITNNKSKMNNKILSTIQTQNLILITMMTINNNSKIISKQKSRNNNNSLYKRKNHNNKFNKKNKNKIRIILIFNRIEELP